MDEHNDNDNDNDSFTDSISTMSTRSTLDGENITDDDSTLSSSGSGSYTDTNKYNIVVVWMRLRSNTSGNIFHLLDDVRQFIEEGRPSEALCLLHDIDIDVLASTNPNIWNTNIADVYVLIGLMRRCMSLFSSAKPYFKKAWLIYPGEVGINHYLTLKARRSWEQTCQDEQVQNWQLAPAA